MSGDERLDRAIGTLVAVQAPIEAGTVIGRTEWLEGSPANYFVRYRAGDGRQVEDWFSRDAIVADPREPARNADQDCDADAADTDKSYHRV